MCVCVCVLVRGEIKMNELFGLICIGTFLTVLMDCCHSGTGLDLPYVSEARGPKPSKEMKERMKQQQKAKKGSFCVVLFPSSPSWLSLLVFSINPLICQVSVFLSDCKLDKKEKKEKKDKKDKKDKKKSGKGFKKSCDCTAVLFSGCEDDQTSADMKLSGHFTGAVR